MDQKVLTDALPWFRTLAMPVPTVNAECVMNNLSQFNFGQHPWVVFITVFGFFRRRRLALDDPESISINLGSIFPTFLSFSGIMKMADFLKRAMVDSFAVGEVLTAEARGYYRLICSYPGLSARGFFGYLEVAPALIACCKRSLLSLDHQSRDRIFLPVPLNAFNATSTA